MTLKLFCWVYFATLLRTLGLTIFCFQFIPIVISDPKEPQRIKYAMITYGWAFLRHLPPAVVSLDKFWQEGILLKQRTHYRKRKYQTWFYWIYSWIVMCFPILFMPPGAGLSDILFSIFYQMGWGSTLFTNHPNILDCDRLYQYSTINRFIFACLAVYVPNKSYLVLTIFFPFFIFTFSLTKILTLNTNSGPLSDAVWLRSTLLANVFCGNL